MNFYKSDKWQRKRKKILRRDGYMCQYWKRYGRLVAADQVHHILPRDRWPEYELADWNLISLSQGAHNKMHDRFTDELTEEGRRLVERTLTKYNIKLPGG